MADHPLFAAVYDGVMARAESGWLGRLRAGVVGRARGRVLDVGAGTGANLAHVPAGVESVVLSEPDGAMRRRLERRVGEARGAGPQVPVEVVAGSVPGLEFEDGLFDTILCTLVLCSVAEPSAALADLRRLLAPDGRLLFLEHVRVTGSGRHLQRLAAPAWQHIAAGCRLDRDTIGSLRAAGFVVADCERPPIVGGSWGGFVVTGSAVRRDRDVA
jgi:SAM-dependent methyltransferase